jgi:TrmH family RNA methyltransferase
MIRATEVIYSKDNALLKRVRQLQHAGSKGQRARLEYMQAVLDGIHLLQTWQGDPRLHCILSTLDAQAIPEITQLIGEHLEQCPDTQLQFIDASLWSSISELENAPQMMAIIDLNKQVATGKNIAGDTIILDSIQDAGNVGTILRTALACKFTQIVCTTGTAHIWSPKVLRAAMGAHRYLTFYEAQTIDDVLSNIEAPLVATTMTAQQSLYAAEPILQKPVAWIFGNEGQGVAQELITHALQIRVPQNPQLESLNVATTAAVCLFETLRVRGTFDQSAAEST